jgi:hypothetical protein
VQAAEGHPHLCIRTAEQQKIKNESLATTNPIACPDQLQTSNVRVDEGGPKTIRWTLGQRY